MSQESSGQILVQGHNGTEYQILGCLCDKSQTMHLGKIASGNFANTEVALKIQRWNTDEEKAQFNKQQSVLHQLQQTNIIQLLNWNMLASIGLLVFPLLQGTDLEDLLKKLGSIPLKTAITIILPLLEALESCHQQDILHGNIAPQNIFIALAERQEQFISGNYDVLHPSDLLLLDFQWTQNITSDTILQHQPQTPYWAPETLEFRAISTSSEIFSVGLIFFRLLTG